MPWYSKSYAGKFGALLEGVERLFSKTFDAIYTYEGTDTFAVFMSCTVFATSVALFLYLLHTTKKK